MIGLTIPLITMSDDAIASLILCSKYENHKSKLENGNTFLPCTPEISSHQVSQTEITSRCYVLSWAFFLGIQDLISELSVTQSMRMQYDPVAFIVTRI